MNLPLLNPSLRHIGWLVLGSLAIARIAVGQTVDVGLRRELFADGFIVEQMSGKAELRLHHPTPQAIAILHNAPWEGNHSLNYSVFRDGKIYRMYYSTTFFSITRVDPGPDAPKGTPTAKREPSPTFCCYAESEDGSTWRKPELGLVEFKGSKANNIVFQREDFGGMRSEPAAVSVMKDENPAVAPDARYKAFLLGIGTGPTPRGLLAFKSPDGVHWQPLQQGPILTDGAFDSQNVVFWDALHHHYRAYWRYYTDPQTGLPAASNRGVRAIRTATSMDLLHWENQADLTYPGSPPQNLYTNTIQPYFRAPHLYVGFPSRYVEPLQEGSLEEAQAPAGPNEVRQWPAALRALPNLSERELRAGISERFGTALTEGLFMVSRDGLSFKRWDEAFMRPGIERTGTWASGQHYLSWPLVETASNLAGAPNELSLYASEGYWLGTGSAVRRHTLRVDGFVSVTAPMSGGELVTKPLRFEGRQLALNFSTSAAGGIRVEIQNLEGKPLPGFSREDCPRLFGDTTERVVTWRHGTDVGSLAGQTVRLCFVLNDADLYAFQFQL